MKLGLGTVQFGMGYGISNQQGQTPVDEVARILSVAQRNNIRIVDTAALYGTSEESLGMVMPAGHTFRIVTKTVRFDAPRPSITLHDAELLESSFERSLQKLKSPTLYGLLLHNVKDLLASGGNLLYERMVTVKNRGLVSKIGVSVYAAEEIDRVLDAYDIDLIQLPVNVLDQRLITGGQLKKLKAAGVEIHARSPLLQGLLLMEPETLSPFFDSVKAHLKMYRAFLSKNGITPVQAAVGFAAAVEEIDAVICGVNNHRQLEELCAAPALNNMNFHQFAINDDTILNPSKWLTNP
ncbi:MAG: aldo/keto reductase [Desulfuromonadales bacterium]|nr:aldo/keto reductase [Desulfuromonadales bacterium]